MKNANRDGLSYRKGVLVVAGLWACFTLSAAAPQDVPPLMKAAAGAAISSSAEWERLRRPEILKTFETQVFGVRPVERPKSLRFETVIVRRDALLSTAVLKRVKLSWSGPRGSQSIIVTAFFPVSAQKSPAPCFLFVSPDGSVIGSQRLHRDRQVCTDSIDERWPVQQMIKRGYAAVAFDATDVAEDDYNAFKADVFGCFQDPEDRTSESWGAILAWAWGASRVMDWLETESLADAKHVAVVGLSHFGKAALWAGATDRRFAMTCASGAGTCGAKLNRIKLKDAETLCQVARFRHWFCRNFDKWAGKEWTSPFDQHWMLSLVAPRLLCLVSAAGDPESGPEGEFYAARLASPAWELYGRKGLDSASFPQAGIPLQEGYISYHVRDGKRDLRLTDWNRFMDFADRHGWRKERTTR